MNIDEIFSRPSPSVYTVEEMIYCVEDYIAKLKGVRVNINIYKGLGNPIVMNPFTQVVLTSQYNKLFEAFNIAHDYYSMNK